MLELTALLPDPIGKDAEEEWIEVGNPGPEAVSGDGWSLVDKSGKTFILKGYWAPGEMRRLGVRETKISLNNTDEELRLIAPDGRTVQKITYARVGEGEVIAARELAAEETSRPLPTATSTALMANAGPAGSGPLAASVPGNGMTGTVLGGVCAALASAIIVARITMTIYAEERTKKSNDRKR